MARFVYNLVSLPRLVSRIRQQRNLEKSKTPRIELDLKTHDPLFHLLILHIYALPYKYTFFS